MFISWFSFNITKIYNLVIAPFWPIAVFPAPNSQVACKRSSSNWPSTNDWWNVVLGFSHTSVPEDFGRPTFNYWSTDQWQPAMVIPGIPLLWRVTRTWVWLTNGRPSRDGQRWSVEEFPQRQSHWPMGGRRSDRWSQFPPTKTKTTHQPWGCCSHWSETWRWRIFISLSLWELCHTPTNSVFLSLMCSSFFTRISS